MTELVVGVKLKADGSGLVGQAKASTAAVEELGRAAVTAGVEAKGLSAGTADAQRSAAQLEATIDGLRAELAQATVATKALEQANAGLSGRVDLLETRLQKTGKAHRSAAADADRHAFGVRNLGQQFGDLGLSIAGGIDPARAFGQQAGQIGYALSEMNGKAGKVGAFLTGPWGIALTIAAAVLAPLVQDLFKAGEAAEAAKLGASGLADAQGVLGDIFDLTTGKLKKQNDELATSNELMRVNARLLAGNLRSEAAQARASSSQIFANAGKPSQLTKVGALAATVLSPGLRDQLLPYGAGSNQAQILAAEARRANAIDPNAPGLSAAQRASRQAERTRAFEGIATASEKVDFTGSGIDRTKFRQAVADAASARAKEQIAADIDASLNSGTLADSLKRDGRTKKPPKPKSTEARDEFGRDAEAKIANLVDRFDGSADVIAKTNQQVRALDDLIDDLSRKKPPGFEKLIESAEAAKVTVREGLIAEIARAFDKPRTLAEQATAAFKQLDAVAADLEQRKPPGFEKLIADVGIARDAIRDGLDRPYNDFIQAQRESLQIGALIATGRTAEADSMRTIVALERQRGPLSDQQKAAVLGTNLALAAQERQLDRLHQRQQIYLNGLGNIRSIITQTIYEGPSSIADLPSRLFDAFKEFQAELVVQDLFGDTFDKMRDQVTGADQVEQASQRMGVAVDGVGEQARQLASSFDQLGAVARDTAGAMQRGVGTAVGGADGITEPDILVTARGRSGLPSLANQRPSDFFGSSLGKAITDLGKKVGINDETAKKIGGFVGEKAGTALKGASEGQAAAVAGMLGIKTNATGSAIGGALGGLTGIPGGALIGGLLGGLVGNLFTKPKTGSATIGAVNGEAGVTGTSGNNKDLKNVSSGMGSQVADNLNSIVDQLGGKLGTFAVSIGQRDKKYVVDTTGRGKTKGAGTQSYKTAEEAEAAALVNALADGAVAGVSDAVQRALRSSTDVTRAVNEALKVANLEKSLGGLSGQLSSIFKDFDRTAADRVSLAKKYGLDLLQVEKLNAEERADLLDQTLKSRVGSLKDLLSNLKYGDLFEGSASDRRSKLLTEIAAAQKDAEAGKAGAADRVADLYRTLIATSKEAFGTAGVEYTADRDQATAAIQKVIDLETERVNAAAGAQKENTDAVRKTNDLLSEGNDIQASILAAINGLADQSNSRGLSPNMALVAR